MITNISRDKDLSEKCKKYFSKIVVMLVCTLVVLLLVSTALAYVCIDLQPEPNSPELWGIMLGMVAVVLVVVRVLMIATVRMNSSYFVYTIHSKGSVCATSVMDIAARTGNIQLPHGALGYLRYAREQSKKAAEIVEEQLNGDNFTNESLFEDSAFRIFKIEKISDNGTDVNIKCGAFVFDRLKNKLIKKKCKFYVSKTDFENFDEILLALEAFRAAQAN